MRRDKGTIETVGPDIIDIDTWGIDLEMSEWTWEKEGVQIIEELESGPWAVALVVRRGGDCKGD